MKEGVVKAFKFTDAEWRAYQNLRDLDYSHREYLEYVINSRLRDITAPFPQKATADAMWGPGHWRWDEQAERIADGNRDLYLGTIRARWEAMTPRQQDRFTRRYSIIGIAIRHLVDDGIIAAIVRGPHRRKTET